MTRKIPILPTLLVAVAVALMIGLGVWQLNRRAWKESLIARYTQAQTLSSEVPWPRDRAGMERALFRWSGFDCERVLGMRTSAATAADGSKGVKQVAHCAVKGGGEAEVALGWSLPVQEVQWSGGPVRGIIGAGGTFGGVLQLSPPAAGLKPLEPLDPAEASPPTPEGHLAYAGQWFFFALTAVVIYVLALRRRWRGRG